MNILALLKASSSWYIQNSTAKQRTIINKKKEKYSKTGSDNKKNELEKPKDQVEGLEELEEEGLLLLFNYEICLVYFQVVTFCLYYLRHSKLLKKNRFEHCLGSSYSVPAARSWYKSGICIWSSNIYLDQFLNMSLKNMILYLIQRWVFFTSDILFQVKLG